jgi:glycosyltransferase involved in cell wall biosynthesis
LAARIDRGRFAPRVIVLAGPPPERQRRRVERLAAADVPVEFLGAERIWQAPRVASGLAAALRAARAELLQTFLFHANALGAIAARRAGTPRVVAGIRVAERRAAWHRWVQRGLAARCDRFVCVSDDVARFSLEQGLPADKIVVIPNGVDLADIDGQRPVPLAELGVTPGRSALCAIGRLDRQKRVDRLLTLLAAEPRVWQHHDLIVVGEGPERAALERLAGALGIARYVRFVGWRADAVGILKSCDLLLHAAQWEGMANVVLEAMACSRAVVVLAAEGMEQLLGDTAAVQIISTDQLPCFAQRVVELLDDAPRRAAVGAQNRSRVAAEFGLGEVVARYEQLYSELLS